jgi:hypothetical protein
MCRQHSPYRHGGRKDGWLVNVDDDNGHLNTGVAPSGVGGDQRDRKAVQSRGRACTTRQGQTAKQSTYTAWLWGAVPQVPSYGTKPKQDLTASLVVATGSLT